LVINDRALLHQWLRVLRLGTGDKVILFNDSEKEAAYRIARIEPAKVELLKTKDMEAQISKVNINFGLVDFKKRQK
jgi:16S rRNA U1498 N3-methylase RsmE